MTSCQSWKYERMSVFRGFPYLDRLFLSFFQLWWLAIFEPVGVKRHNVPHFKGLISAHLNPRSQGCDSTFTFCHFLLKMSILPLKMATVRFFLNTAVFPSFINFVMKWKYFFFRQIFIKTQHCDKKSRFRDRWCYFSSFLFDSKKSVWNVIYL